MRVHYAYPGGIDNYCGVVGPKTSCVEDVTCVKCRRVLFTQARTKSQAILAAMEKGRRYRYANKKRKGKT